MGKRKEERISSVWAVRYSKGAGKVGRVGKKVSYQENSHVTRGNTQKDLGKVEPYAGG